MKFRVLVLTALTTLAPALGHAQEADERARSAARTLAEDGVTALQNNDVPTAVDKLERAYQIVKLPTVGIWSARALVKTGRLVSAAERYLEVSRYKDDHDARQQAAKGDALKEYEQLMPRIPTATPVIEGAKASETSVTLDGEPIPSALVGTAIPVDPKHHVMRATHGTDSSEGAFDVTEGQKITVTLKLQGGATPAVTPPPSGTPVTASAGGDVTLDSAPSSPGSGFWNTQRTIGVVVGGAGIVSAAVSGIFTASALGKKSDSKAFCDGGACRSQEGVDLLNDARSAGNVATITGIAGIALIGAGVVLFVTAPSGSASPSVAVAPAVLPGGGFLSARGTF